MSKGIVAAQKAKYSDISASTLVKGGAGTLLGFYVNSTTSGVITIYDSLTGTGTKILNAATPAAGMHPLPPIRFETGLYVNKDSGTIDLTIFYAP